MMAFVIFFLWCITFVSHDSLQTHSLKLMPLSKAQTCLAHCIRALAPLLALVWCLYSDPAKGILLWLGLGSVAGVTVALALAYYKNKRSAPAQRALRQKP
ncbi:hypothetical protein ACI01nite_00450 [Acetobacter cibinongensis]|uniref:DUF3325 domain-containing protein n=1 Tax=Acetobacter cibinongensis TaxID=146475 RepID=A0A0D6N0U4_9PROT|nr:hypothetical protein [Acetobacter cibinongensis]GAN59554.1 hypothetical protein Abci_006_033 [Acetobacter cibinongensis]GEL57443.1 hypothetical protein ACI01nite_00450 [Acetobacter cibinongensis]